MKQLRTFDLNTPELSEKILLERWKGCPHWVDYERFAYLVSRFNGSKYLDLGCFNSPMPFELTRRGYDVTAVDHSKGVIERMKTIFPEVHYECSDVRKLPFGDGSFDYIVAAELLEHMMEPKKAIHEWMRVLKTGGILAISTPKDERNISAEHIFSFDKEDMQVLFERYGKPEITVKDYGFETFIVFTRKV